MAYDGTEFHGWAAQPGQRTVEGILAGALSTIFRTDVALTVAGRTDAGVHARGQVVHFDIDTAAWEALPGRSDLPPGSSLLRRVNALLAREASGPRGSADVVVHRARLAPDGFDSRFSALWRSYSYRVCDDLRAFDPLRRRDVLWLAESVDVDAMNRAATGLLGEHDFISYCKPREGATTVRELQSLRASRRDGLIELTAQADAFCHSMVRTLVGSLLRVGLGTRDEQWPARRLSQRSRNGEVVVAPAHPLTLEHVEYPADSELAGRAALTRNVRNCGCPGGVNG